MDGGWPLKLPSSDGMFGPKATRIPKKPSIDGMFDARAAPYDHEAVD